jgi:hypothetical protein
MMDAHGRICVAERRTLDGQPWHGFLIIVQPAQVADLHVVQDRRVRGVEAAFECLEPPQSESCIKKGFSIRTSSKRSLSHRSRGAEVGREPELRTLRNSVRPA